MYIEKNPGLHRTKQPWYENWKGAVRRCTNPESKQYKRYGGRGIKVDMNFWHFGVLYYRDKADQMIKPNIHRIDNDGDYSYKNCRFIDQHEHSGITNKGRTHSLRSRRNMSQAHIGKKPSLETREKMSKERRGEKNPQSRLTKKQVLLIRKEQGTTSNIAEKFQISRGAVWAIQKRKNWGWL